jgi:hypothetical protein
MGESALYYRNRNLLIKFNGLYWYWSPAESGWISDRNLQQENWFMRDLTSISEEEAQKTIMNVSPA